MTPTDALHAAVRHLQAGRPGPASELLRQLLARDPNQVDALQLLGMVALESGDPHEGIRLMSRSLRIHPQQPHVHVNLGNAHRAAGDPAEAVASYRQALRLQPDNVDALYNLGLTVGVVEGPEAAVDAFRRAVALVPGSDELQFRLGTALRTAGETAQARVHLERALALEPRNADALNDLGRMRLAEGEPREAAALLCRAVAARPQDPQLSINLASALLRDGRPGEARAALQTALAADRGNVEALSLMLVALGELGDTRARRTLFDPDRDLHVTSLQAPEGFDDQLAEALIAHPSLTWEPEGLTTTAGSQTARLSAADHPVIARFEALLRRVLDRFLAARVPDPSHPRDFQVPTDFELNLWGTVLSEGGHQAPHIHPAGWLSGVYYAKVPSTVSGADPTQAGWIEFDRAGYGLPVSASVAPRVVCPQQGALVLFPSALFHRTLPLRGTDLRVSLAFDLHPTGFRR